MKQEGTSSIRCPECGNTNLHRMGTVWSGRNKIQRYRCPKCGRTCTEYSAATVKGVSNDTGK